MKNKQVVMLVIVAILGAGFGFWGGKSYSQQSRAENFGQRQQFRNVGGGMMGAGRQGGGAGFVSGEILSQDDKSVTVKLRDGGSKIIFFSDTTSIGKTTDGTKADLEVGKEIMVTGSVNSDGSVTAQNIQIRPSVPMPASNPQ